MSKPFGDTFARHPHSETILAHWFRLGKPDAVKLRALAAGGSTSAQLVRATLRWHYESNPDPVVDLAGRVGILEPDAILVAAQGRQPTSKEAVTELYTAAILGSQSAAILTENLLRSAGESIADIYEKNTGRPFPENLRLLTAIKTYGLTDPRVLPLLELATQRSLPGSWAMRTAALSLHNGSMVTQAACLRSGLRIREPETLGAVAWGVAIAMAPEMAEFANGEDSVAMARAGAMVLHPSALEAYRVIGVDDDRKVALMNGILFDMVIAGSSPAVEHQLLLDTADFAIAQWAREPLRHFMITTASVAFGTIIAPSLLDG